MNLFTWHTFTDHLKGAKHCANAYKHLQCFLVHSKNSTTTCYHCIILIWDYSEIKTTQW